MKIAIIRMKITEITRLFEAKLLKIKKKKAENGGLRKPGTTGVRKEERGIN